MLYLIIIFLHCLIYAGCHICYIIYKIFFYCRICIRSRKNEHRGRQQSIPIGQNDKIINGVDNKYYKLSSVEAKRYAIKWIIIGSTVLLMMLFFLCLSIYCTVAMIRAGVQSKGEYDAWKISRIYAVMILLGLSFFDSPLIWLKVYEKCISGKNTQDHDGPPPELL